MNSGLLLLATLAGIFVLIQLGDAKFCNQRYTCYRRYSTKRQNCRSSWWRRRCTYSTAYGSRAETCTRRACCTGYQGSACTDINECSSSRLNRCDHNCHNTVGSYTCSCRAGYKLGTDGRTCIDINECSTGAHNCDHTCVNTPGSYTCKCNSGYSLSSNGRTCSDINECTGKTHGCNHVCTNTAGSYTCSCLSSSFTLMSDGRTCQGKYVTSKCTEKVLIRQRCGIFGWSRCLRYQIQYKSCRFCMAGFSGDNCATPVCYSSTSCANGGTCIGPDLCSCPAGYSQPKCESVCSDHECEHSCTPTGTSYVCTCNSGYVLNDDGKTCDVANPCETNNGGCNHVCKYDSPGRHTCLCRSGYTLQYDRRTCTDDNECLKHPCDHTCTNNAGSYTCACRNGYTPSMDGARCTANNLDDLRSFFLFTDTFHKRIYKMDYYNQSLQYYGFADVSNPIAIDHDPATGLMFWTDVGNKRIYSSVVDASNRRIVRRLPFYSIPDGLTLDTTRRKVYYTDTGLDIIASMDYSGQNHKEIIKTGLTEPRAIVLDTPIQRMYWTDWGAVPKIEQSRFDGTNRQTLVSTGLTWPNGLVLVKEESRLYWTDAGKKKIEFINLDGTGRTVVYSTSFGHFFDVVNVGNLLFYSDWKRNHLRNVQIDGRNPLSFGPYGFGRINGLYLYDDGTHDGSGPIDPDPEVCQEGEMCADFAVEGSIQSELDGVTVISAVSAGTTANCSRQAVFRVQFNQLSTDANSPTCHDGAYNQRQMLKVDLFLNSERSQRSGWQFNVGDSKSNDGYAGDSGHSDFAAEIQGKDSTITTYASCYQDRISNDCKCQNLWSDSLIGEGVNHVTVYIANNYFYLETDAGEQKEMCNKCLFGLDGRNDYRAGNQPADTNVYIAVNRVIGGTSRTGYGICSLKMSWVEAGCVPGEWQCRDGGCIPLEARCDDFPGDCADDSDELECVDGVRCNEGQVLCRLPDGSEVCRNEAVGCGPDNVGDDDPGSTDTSDSYSGSSSSGSGSTSSGSGSSSSGSGSSPSGSGSSSSGSGSSPSGSGSSSSGSGSSSSGSGSTSSGSGSSSSGSGSSPSGSGSSSSGSGSSSSGSGSSSSGSGSSSSGSGSSSSGSGSSSSGSGSSSSGSGSSPSGSGSSSSGSGSSPSGSGSSSSGSGSTSSGSGSSSSGSGSSSSGSGSSSSGSGSTSSGSGSTSSGSGSSSSGSGSTSSGSGSSSSGSGSSTSGSGSSSSGSGSSSSGSGSSPSGSGSTSSGSGSSSSGSGSSSSGSGSSSSGSGSSSSGSGSSPSGSGSSSSGSGSSTSGSGSSSSGSGSSSSGSGSSSSGSGSSSSGSGSSSSGSGSSSSGSGSSPSGSGSSSSGSGSSSSGSGSSPSGSGSSSSGSGSSSSGSGSSTSGSGSSSSGSGSSSSGSGSSSSGSGSSSSGSGSSSSGSGSSSSGSGSSTSGSGSSSSGSGSSSSGSGSSSSGSGSSSSGSGSSSSGSGSSSSGSGSSPSGSGSSSSGSGSSSSGSGSSSSGSGSSPSGSGSSSSGSGSSSSGSGSSPSGSGSSSSGSGSSSSGSGSSSSGSGSSPSGSGSTSSGSGSTSSGSGSSSSGSGSTSSGSGSSTSGSGSTSSGSGSSSSGSGSSSSGSGSTSSGSGSSSSGSGSSSSGSGSSPSGSGSSSSGSGSSTSGSGSSSSGSGSSSSGSGSSTSDTSSSNSQSSTSSSSSSSTTSSSGSSTTTPSGPGGWDSGSSSSSSSGSDAADDPDDSSDGTSDGNSDSNSGSDGDSGSSSDDDDDDDDDTGSGSGSGTYFGCNGLTTCNESLVRSALAVPNSDCENYCQCMETMESGITKYAWKEYHCGAGHIWDADERFCDSDDHSFYECPDGTYTGPEELRPKCVGTCTGPSDLHKLTDRNNTECVQFCQCVQSDDGSFRWQELYCQHGSLWASKQKRCIAEYQMNCLANGTGVYTPVDDSEDPADVGGDDPSLCQVELCAETQAADLMLLPYSNCSRFCQCAPAGTLADGTASYKWVVRQCAYKAYWNHRTRQCGSFDPEGCKAPYSEDDDEIDVDITVPVWQGPSVFNCSGVCSDAFHGNLTSQLKSNCTQYCHCAPKTNSELFAWVPMFCAAGTLFESNELKCMHEDDVMCQENGIGVYIGEEEDETSGVGDVCPLGGCSSLTSGNTFVVQDTDCRQYCKCSPFTTDSSWNPVYKWVTFTCPDGQGLNATSGLCEAYQPNICQEETTSSSSAKCEGTCYQSQWGSLNVSTDPDCRSFCQCSPLNNDPDFYWQIIHCGANTRFSQNYSTCVHENNANCSGKNTTVVEGTCPVDECRFIQNQNLMLLPGSDCKKFCQCSPLKTHLNGTAEYTWVVKDCAPGTKWNEETGNCGHFDEDSYICPDQHGSRSACAYAQSDQDPYCSFMTTYFNGTAEYTWVVKDCAPGTKWNDETGNSGHFDEDTCFCLDTGSSAGSSSGGINDGCPAQCSLSQHGNFTTAVDATCLSYCQCAPAHNGGYTWLKMYCAPGTLFDKAAKQCLLADNVECTTVP